MLVKSKAWTASQSSWSTVHKECDALVSAIRSSEKFLQFVEFTAFTDHRPLLGILRALHLNNNLWNGAALRYVTYLMQFRMTISYIPGRDNKLADIMSRYPFVRK